MSRIKLSLIGECLIEVDGSTVTPSASHLFALLLYLSVETTRWFRRQELQDVLFGRAAESSLTSHRLRQLLYRLRRKGVLFDERVSDLRLAKDQVVSPLASFKAFSVEARACLSASHLRVLPAYCPPLSQEFTEWLDGYRDTIERDIRHHLFSDFATLRAADDWATLSPLCDALRALDPLNESIVRAAAESHAMMGHRESALALLDAFEQDAALRGTPSASLTQLKSRITKAGLLQRQTPFIGRRDSVAMTHAMWTSAAGGGARVLAVVGPAGVGKSRLADEVANSLALGGANVVNHRCDSLSRAYPLSLFSSILPELRAFRGSLGVAPHNQLLLDRLRDRATPSHDTLPGILRAEIQVAVTDLLEAVSAERRLLLVVDDAHFLDPASIAVLHHLSTSANTCRLLTIVCCRSTDTTDGLFEPSERSTLTVLRPLNPSDSRALLTHLIGQNSLSTERLSWCISEAGGNPFFLHALSLHALSSSPPSSVPIGIRSLAEGLYSALSPTERLVLECCQFLGGHATLARVSAAVGVEDVALAAAMRRLEEHALVRMTGDVVNGPHSLLDAAIRALIPSTVTALVHKRVASVLARECDGTDFSPSLALAAAQSFLAANDVTAALGLLVKCADAAASIGEPAAAAELLSQLQQSVLPLGSRRLLLESIARYAAAGGARTLAAQTLRERLALARATQESASVLIRLELGILEADLLNGADYSGSISVIEALLSHPDASRDVNLLCITQLLIIADAQYDPEMAATIWKHMTNLSLIGGAPIPLSLRAQLIYHTTFGETDTALRIAKEIIAIFPTPSLDNDARTSRRFASYAMYRLMLPDEARVIIEQEFHFMVDHAIRSEALYASSLLTEIAISQGDFLKARHWFVETERQLRGTPAHKLSPNSGYYSSAALLAMMDGRYTEAERLLEIPQREDARMQTARYEAICLALHVRLQLMRGSFPLSSNMVTRLKTLYRRGRAFGAQDSIVEQLWCIEVLAGREDSASLLLVDYFTLRRREKVPPEWSLLHTTSADQYWNQNQPVNLPDISRRRLGFDCARSAGGKSQFQKSLASR